MFEPAPNFKEGELVALEPLPDSAPRGGVAFYWRDSDGAPRREWVQVWPDVTLSPERLLEFSLEVLCEQAGEQAKDGVVVMLPTRYTRQSLHRALDAIGALMQNDGVLP